MKKILLFLVVLGSLVYTMESPEKIVLAHENRNAYPWVMPVEDGYAGIDLEILEIVSKRLKVPIKFVSYPWIRCLEEMRSGNIDGVFASSHREEREAMGRYPRSSGELDSSRKIHISGYSLYLRRGSNVDFDGEKFINLNGLMGVQRSFSIIPGLEPFGIEMDDKTADPEAILKKLMVGRVDAAALQTARADNVIENNRLLNQMVVRYDVDYPPFLQKPYFVMFSHQFYEKYPDFTEKFWDTLPEAIKSDEFKKAQNKFFENF